MRSRSSRLATSAAAVGSLALAGLPSVSAAPVTFQNGTATCSQANFSVDEAIDGVVNDSDGWGILCSGATAAQTAAFETTTDLTGGARLLSFVLSQQYTTPSFHTIGRFRLSVTTADRSSFADGLDNGGSLGMADIWTVLDPVSATSTGGAILTEQGDNSILASGTNPLTATYRVMVPTSLSPITGIRLELLEDASLPFSGPGRQPTNGNLVLSELTLDVLACTTGRLDVDGNGTVGALTDALLLLRYVFGFRDDVLIAGAVGAGCSRCLADDIETYIASILSELDVDGDGTVGSLTDMLLVLRFAFGFRDSVLLTGALGAQCTRCTAEEVEAQLACLFL